ncbi:ECF transporter S component [Lapillicoccus sp.]|uniref:ECF transporter S component n=1 Tax=Lapillicoccus sp. TaxID=1909287 RepID=UPI00326709F0
MSTVSPRTILATRPLARWRTIDLLTCAFIGVAFGVAYWGWGLAYTAPSAALTTVFPPLVGITAAPWLMAGVVGGLVIRRPGAALFAEIVAASVEGLIGSQWGVTTLVSGALQGLGAEIGFALLSYASFMLGAAILSGALAAPMEAVYEWYAYWTDWDMTYKVVYLVVFTVAGGLVAGGLGWLLTTGLARAGALNALPPGQEVREASAV